MPLMNPDLWNSMLKVGRRGGAVFYDRIPTGAANATAAGTAAARVSITTSYPIPNLAVELLALSPGLATTASAAADSCFGYADIQGNSYKFQPQQVLAPVGSVFLSVGDQRFTPQEWWNVRSPVNANDTYDWGFTSLIANSHNMKAWDDVMYATVPSNDPIIYSQVSTVTAFKAAGSNPTSSLTLTAANGLYELATGLSPEAAAVAQENMIASTTVNCPSLSPVQQMTYGQESPDQIGATSGDTRLNMISRYVPIGHAFKISSPQLTFATTLDVATSNNVSTANCVRYTSF